MSQWYRFNWDIQPVPLQTMHCALLCTEDTCIDVIRLMTELQSAVGSLAQCELIEKSARQFIVKGLDKNLFLVPGFFRFGNEMHLQFFNEEARRFANAFQMLVGKHPGQLLMIKMDGDDFDRVCKALNPQIVRGKPYK